MKATPKEMRPALEFSAPMVGPTFWRSFMTQGTGSAPPLSRPARSSASWKVKLPEICVLPLVMALITRGALYTTLSIEMAIMRSLFSVVMRPHSEAPSSVMERLTMMLPSVWS